MRIPERFRPQSLIHTGFEIGIFLKGLDGALELVGGAILLIVRPRSVSRVILFLIQHELSEDPHDFVANLLVRIGHHITAHTELFASIYLFTHGAVKLALVAALFYEKLWAYPAAIAVFVLFGVYQMYRYALQHSPAMILLTVLDVFVIALTWLEYRRLRRE
jgi:uncharacterized membrane protein